MVSCPLSFTLTTTKIWEEVDGVRKEKERLTTDHQPLQDHIFVRVVVSHEEVGDDGPGNVFLLVAHRLPAPFGRLLSHRIRGLREVVNGLLSFLLSFLPLTSSSRRLMIG